MSSWAAIGKQCVCIDADFSPILDLIAGINRQPMVNEVLTIASIETDEGTHLGFVEIPLSFAVPGGLVEVWWGIGHFRPLVEHTVETDAAMFLGILADAGELA